MARFFLTIIRVKIKKNGFAFEFVLDGPVGEGSPLFSQDVREATQITINAEKMTYINSIGVKNWILWTVRISPNCKFELIKAPLVMINQASQVVGFLPPKATIQSFNAPFVCPDCNVEKMVLLNNNQEYFYATASTTRRLEFPKIACSKCSAEMEPDFLESKTFAFLDSRR